MRAKIVIIPKATEKFVPPAYRNEGGGWGEDTKYPLSSYKAVYWEVLSVLVD